MDLRQALLVVEKQENHMCLARPIKFDVAMMVCEIGYAGDDLSRMLWNGKNNYTNGCTLSNIKAQEGRINSDNGQSFEVLQHYLREKYTLWVQWILLQINAKTPESR